ncbi:MAG TPA: hypothetical protein VM100_03880 [Longimicrobiales bacterium]|nr:hypothetical protein [Longimicrobiales bacterium]
MKRFFRALVVALVLTTPILSGCADSTGPVTATQVQPQNGLITDLLGTVLNLVGGLISGADANGPDASVWIGPAGGTVTTAAYTLIIPANAVTKSTRFDIEPLNTGVYSVELHAYQKGGLLNLSLIDVGSKGFLKPVTLRMSYAKAYNVTDPNALVIVYFAQGIVEIKPSAIDLVNKTVTSQLNHFSKYCMATN